MKKWEYEYAMELDDYCEKYPENRLPKKMPASGWRKVKIGEIAKVGDVLFNPQSFEPISHYLAMSFGDLIKSDWSPLYRKYKATLTLNPNGRMAE